MRKIIKTHGKQFSLYFISGCTAVVVDYGSYILLLQIGVWYIAASVVGGILGFFAAFLGHKYFVFKKKDNFMNHIIRFLVLDLLNIAATAAILYILVEFIGLGEEIAKVIAMGSVVLWNFFLYKFFVYV